MRSTEAILAFVAALENEAARAGRVASRATADLADDPELMDQSVELLRNLADAAGDLALLLVRSRRFCAPRTRRQALEWLLDGEGVPGGAAVQAISTITLGRSLAAGTTSPAHDAQRLRRGLARGSGLAALAHAARHRA